MLINIIIRGVTPLIVNRFHEEAQAEASRGVHSRKETMTPEEDARNRLYMVDEKPYVPAENLRKSLIEAAKRHKIGRRAATTDVAAALFITPFALLLEGEWTVDSRPVVIPATQGRILRHRPIFHEWSLSFLLQVDTDLLDADLARRILDDAGNYVGIGDFRPARTGPYGRFRVDSYQPR